MNCTIKLGDSEETVKVADIKLDEKGTVKCPICLTPMLRVVFVGLNEHYYCEPCEAVFLATRIEDIRLAVWGARE